MSTKVDMGLKVLCLFVILVFSMVFDSFCLDLFGCFDFFGFPYGFDILKLLHCMFKRVPGNN